MSALDIDIAEKAFPGPGGGKLTVLSGLRISVAEGEFACLVGPSGCGKTTLLNLISGLDRNVEGTVRVDGGAAVGYMFQSPRLMPWLTAHDNVRLVAGDEDDDAIDALLGEMGLEGFGDTYPNRLSGGMRRRVALARAFVNRPGVLLLDEPFLSLDLPQANRLRRLLIDLCRHRPTTVLFVTHDLREALYLADRVLFMSARPGRIVLEFNVDLPRPRDPEGEAIEKLRLGLLGSHSRLLAGLVGTDEQAAGRTPGGPGPESNGGTTA